MRGGTECGLRPVGAGPTPRRERKRVRSWEDEKVSRTQSAWGIGLKADVGRWEKARLRDGEVFLFWIWDFGLWNGEVAIE